MSRHPVRVAIAALAAALVSGCAGTFYTTEIVRPVVIDSELSAEAEIEAIESDFGDTPPVERRYWVPATRSAVSLASVQKYGSYLFFLERLARSLEPFPDNPYAWVYLGVYLALQHQPEAAIEATEEGLRKLRSRGRLSAEVAARHQQLYDVAVLNLAIYNLTLERYPAAVHALGRIAEPKKLDPYRRLAYDWIDAWASSGTRRPEDARRALKDAASISTKTLRESALNVRAFYPQYFSDSGRSASRAFLEGLLAIDEGDPVGAQKQLQAAIAANPIMWEAHYSLGRALFLQGKVDAAREQLQGLIRDLPDDGYYRREVLLFTLGNLELGEGHLQAASDAYKHAADLAMARSNGYVTYYGWKRVDKGSSAGQIIARTLEPNRMGYPEAENNLAYVYLERVERRLYGDSTRAKLLAAADFYLHKVLANPTYKTPYIAHANLARANLLDGRWDAFLVQSAASLSVNRLYTPPVRLLLTAAAAQPDLEQAAKAYALAFDSLSIAPDSRLILERFSEEVIAARKRLEAGPAGREQARALLRLYSLTGQSVAQRELLDNLRTSFPNEMYTAVGIARQELEVGEFTSAERRLTVALDAATGAEGPAAEPDRRDANHVLARVRLHRCAETKVCDNDAFMRALESARQITPDWAPADLRRALR